MEGRFFLHGRAGCHMVRQFGAALKVIVRNADVALFPAPQCGANTGQRLHAENSAVRRMGQFCCDSMQINAVERSKLALTSDSRRGACRRLRRDAIQP
uniref:Uncharacterized protein n=1 Tax=mine drainage metagenome TaxID=410659 RepID=E6PVL5_9ZZZZ